MGNEFDLAAFPDRTTEKLLKVSNESVRVHGFWVQFMPAREGEKLRGQARAALGGIPRGLGELSHAVFVRCTVFDKLEIPGNHHEQIIEVVGDAARELADGLHLLTLMQLLLDQATGFHGLLMPGDVSEQDGKAFTRRECIDLVPPGAQIAEYFEVG
jgi:hypothetical protein